MADQIEIALPGCPRETTEENHGLGGFAEILGAETIGSTDVRTARTRGTDKKLLTRGDPNDILELTWEDGIVELIRAEDLSPLTRSNDGYCAIPTKKTIKNGFRGEEEFCLDAVKRIGLKAAEIAVDYAVPKVIKKIEEHRIPEPGLFRLNELGELIDKQEDKIKTNHTILVLVHGTFSNTQGGFSDLFASRDWDRITKNYKDNIFALEQHTVTASPARNAIQLATPIPDGAKVHLLSHSRGGLVGELLCRYPWESKHINAFFSDDQYEQVRRELVELARVRGDFEVERFARVAAPAAGTLLASERLNQYLNVILTVLGKLLGPNAVWFDFVKAIAMAIVATRAKADALPGIQAMMPFNTGADKAHGFVPFLNVTQPRGKELAVIAGDIRGGGFFDRVKSFFADLYYREDNDFVVDSKSMFRGVPRKKARGFYYRAPKANHFSYFKEQETRSRIVDWLVDGNDLGFRTLTAAEPYGGLRGSEPLRSIEPIRDRENMPTVFLIPGIMGSHLAVDGDRHWISIFGLAWKGFSPLQIDNNEVSPDALVDMVYEKLFYRLQEHYNVRPFPFDWRLPIRDSARALGDEVEKELNRHNRPVRLVAHSMGGLVARTLIMDRPEIWKRLTDRGGRLVMMGTPNFGSYSPAQVLTKKHKLMKQLALVALRQDLDELTDIVREFPGLVEMLPKYDSTNLFDPQQWKRIENSMPHLDVLNKAHAWREALDKSDGDAKHMVYVAGHAADTPKKMEVDEHGEVTFRYSGRGDGTVPWDFGLLEGVKTYYVEAEHGQIANHEPSFDGYIELLAQGTTTKLSMTPPVTSRGAEELRKISTENEDEAPRYYPSADDLIATITGMPSIDEIAIEEPLELVVFNGDVRECKHPVLVGHYEGDPIVSVEATLNRVLDGAMSRDHRLDRYVDRLGSVRIYGKHKEFPGVVTSGLGEVGTLTRTRLEEALRHAMMEFALKNLPGPDKPAQRLRLSGVLIGSYGATKISVEDSIQAYVEAARYTNAGLQKEGLSDRVRLVGIEIAELYQDIAIEATQSALRIAESSNHPVDVSPKLQHRTGALKFRPRTPYGSGWQRRIRINKNKDDNLEYEMTTEMARVEPTTRSIQWSHVDGLLERAMHADRTVARTLFHYLLPYEMLKGADVAPDLVLQLHPETAHIPWELLDPGKEGHPPIGVRVAVLRNFFSIERRVNPLRSKERRALVIGEPAMVSPPLPAAKEEAEFVANFLYNRGIEVNRIINRDADDCFESLFQGEYDIVHVAAHGRFDGTDPKKTGVVLADHRYLGAGEFENMVAVPSIVFLNCCHLGKINPLKQPGRMAASVSKRLIEIGVKVVVVAGWAVGDAAAKEFAENLYTALLDGQNLMKAVRIARQATYDLCSSSDVTWGAYQVYGDPGFVLPYAGQGRDSERSTPRFVSIGELIDYVSDFVSRSRDMNQDQIAQLTEDLGQVTDGEFARNHPEWFEDGELLAVIADIYSDLGDFERAISWYERALASSNTPLKAIEQLANLEARLAEQLIEKNAPKDQIDDLFKSSLKRLDDLCSIKESSERLCLRGATLKRMADFDKANAEELLQQSLAAYQSAADLNPRDLYYPLDNVIQLQLLLDDNIDMGDLIKIEKSAAQSNDKWAPGSAANAALFRYAITGLGSVQDTIEAYARVLNGGIGVTERERQSILGSLKRLDGVKNSTIKGRLKAIADAVNEMTKTRGETGIDR